MAITRRRVTRPRARLTRQGQITVPKAVREALTLRAGDELEFEVGDESVVVRPRRRPNILEFAGVAGDLASAIPRTARELDEILHEEKASRARRRFKQ